ncbi:MAG: hypothetical protein ACRDP9_28090 [Kribbellaceae bacterium]
MTFVGAWASPVIVFAPILDAFDLTLVTVWFWFDGQGGHHHGQD